MSRATADDANRPANSRAALIREQDKCFYHVDLIRRTEKWPAMYESSAAGLGRNSRWNWLLAAQLSFQDDSK
jgi:hypothetical protein